MSLSNDSKVSLCVSIDARRTSWEVILSLPGTYYFGQWKQAALCKLRCSTEIETHVQFIIIGVILSLSDQGAYGKVD